MADFEEAIHACGLGPFDFLLIFASIASPMCTIFTIASYSYIQKDIECHLRVYPKKKGILNSISFAGMIVGAIPWGFIGDVKGRKVVLVFGLLLDSVTVMACALSQNFHSLVTFKFFDGILISGPTSVAVAYAAEFYSFKSRSVIALLIGMMNAVGSAVLAGTAYVVLSKRIETHYNDFHIYTWNYFLMVFFIPPFLGGIFHMMLPESPKFLLSRGRNEDALECLKTIYHMNKCKPKDSYPIEDLKIIDMQNYERNIYYKTDEYKMKMKIFKNRWLDFKLRLKSSFSQFKPLFKPPFIWMALHVYILHFSTLFGLNTMTLWLPQLFATITEYKNAIGSEYFSMCDVISWNRNKTEQIIMRSYVTKCTKEVKYAAGYLNNVYVACFIVAMFLLTSLVIRKVGYKLVMIICFSTASMMSIVLWASYSTAMTLCTSCLFLSCASIGANCTVGTTIALFPTSIRSMTVTILILCGRLGGLVGNAILPLLIETGCLLPFLTLSSFMCFSMLLTIFLPKPQKQ